MDFANAQLPRLLPLENSYAENEVEADLKRLFIDLFTTLLAADTFDANVLGAAHLGSFDLVRQAVNADGLVLMRGDSEETSTRYLYRAWKSGNTQGRGLHFLRTYLQMLFPNQCKVSQLWHSPTAVYPMGAVSLADGESSDGLWLTSRIEIAMDFGMAARSISSFMQIIRSVIPARLVPVFNFMMIFVFKTDAKTAPGRRLMQKKTPMRYPWCGRVISDRPDVMWPLGPDEGPAWKMRGCRITGRKMLQKRRELSGYSPVVSEFTWTLLKVTPVFFLDDGGALSLDGEGELILE